MKPSSHFVSILGKLSPSVRSEIGRMFRFGVIGVASLGLNVGFYALLSRVIWPDGSRTLEYVISTIIVTYLNYEANRHFTFDVRQRTVGAMGRFATVAVIALGLNASLFWFWHEVLYLPDLWVIVGSTLIVAVFTFSSHRLFTFHPEPWRLFRRGGSK
jgi:putative flippase GtrA